MSFLTSVLLFSNDRSAIERLSDVIEEEWGRFKLVGRGGWVDVWRLAANHLRIDDLVTLINSNVWYGTPQVFTMTEDGHKYTEIEELNPNLIRTGKVWHMESRTWIDETYIERRAAQCI